MKKKLNLLIVEDSVADAELLARRLKLDGFEFSWNRVDTEQEFVSRLETALPDLIISDHHMPTFDSIRAAKVLAQRGLDIPFILVSGSIGEEAAVEVMKHGASDYLLKDRIARLGAAVTRALEQKQLRDAQRRAEAELQRALAQLRHLLELSPVVIYTLRFQGDERVPVVVSGSMERMLGYSVEEAMRAAWWQDQVHPEDRERVLAGSAAVLQHGAGTLEYRFRHRNGSYRWVADIRSVVRDAAGKPSEVIGALTDISQRKRAELHTSGFARLGNKLSFATTVLEAGEIIIEVADEMFGWDSCALDLYDAKTDLVTHILNRDTVGGTRRSFPPEREVRPPTPRMRRVIQEGPLLQLREPPYQMDEGRPFGDESRASASLMFVPISHGRAVLGVLAIHAYRPEAYNRQDLLELQSLADHCAGTLNRIGAETALRESEERFRQLVDNIKEVFWMTDVQKNQMIYVSPGYEEIWGRSRESLYESPRNWLDAIHPEDRERVGTAARDHQAAGNYDEQYRIFRPDGSERWIRDRAFPIRNAAGAVYRVAGIAEDVTERRELEARLRQGQKLELLGQLAGGVAHDFNNILAVIQGLASVVFAADGLPADVREAAQEMVYASERGAGLTRQLLAFGRRQVVQPRHLDLNEIVGNVAKLLTRMLGARVVLEVRGAPALPKVNADAVMMQQVLMNLAVNARDAMPGGGVVIVATADCKLEAGSPALNPDSAPGRYVCLSVTDSGCGIPEHILPKIFEPFFTTKAAGSGTGLGLATVYGIAKQHGGWVKVQSEVGLGTTFHLFLPAIPESDLPEEVKEINQLAADPATILIADDEGAFRLVIRNLLRRQGYQVLEADSGPDALRVWELHNGRIDLLLTDMVMPGGMSGRELADQLQARAPGLKVVYHSGQGQQMLPMDPRIQTGVNYLQKPYNLNALVKMVRTHLEHPAV